MNNPSTFMQLDSINRLLEEINKMELNQISEWKSKKPATLEFTPSKELQQKIDHLITEKVLFEYRLKETSWKIEANIDVFNGMDIISAFEKFKEKVEKARKYPYDSEDNLVKKKKYQDGLLTQIQERWRMISDSMGERGNEYWSLAYIGLEKSNKIGVGWSKQLLPNLFRKK